MKRRDLFKVAGALSLVAAAPSAALAATKKPGATFSYCLNTSTISGNKPGIVKYLEIASKAGYDGIELWVSDVKTYLSQGNTLSSLRSIIDASGLTVENAIGFAPWLTADDEKRKAGFGQMKEEMELMAALGCKRIAAPAAGLKPENAFDLVKAGERYKQLIELGRQTGVMPQLEFWGASGVLSHIGQCMMIAAIANDPDVRILADVYHMFRGQSGYNSLKMLNGNVIEIFHINDFVASIPREQQTDKDRVYPGDGAAPMKQILTDLNNMGGNKVLSLELFNPGYWRQDELLVAKTGLEKMKELVNEIQS
jgi:sugar phosphate isomerase/epimerase